MAELKKHHLDNTVSLRRIKRSKNDFVIILAKKHILNIKSIKHSSRFSTKNLNIISKHLKSSHSENEETHLTIICYLSKSNPYSCFNITRQKKKSAIATFTRNLTFIQKRSISSLSHRFITSIIIFYAKRLAIFIFSFIFILWFYISFTS